MEHLILIGAGGYAKSVLDSIDYYNYKLEGFLDQGKRIIDSAKRKADIFRFLNRVSVCCLL